MDFGLTDEQRMIIKTTRDFVTNELMPHEAEVEETGVLRPELHKELKAKAIDGACMRPTCRPRSAAQDSIR